MRFGLAARTATPGNSLAFIGFSCQPAMAVASACGVIERMTPFASQDFGFQVDDRRAAADVADGWAVVPQMFRALRPLPAPWEERFGPLRGGAVDDLVVVGQFGQSLDGRVATETGHSHYINGPAGLAHLHRLRALVDVVVVGVSTALADNPQLTVRHVSGPCPARVVIDPRGRMRPDARMFADDGVRRLAIAAEGTRPDLPAGVECVRLPARDGALAPAAILAALAERGFRRMLIEGGSHTVSRFLAAGCLDRLHIVVAPIILGAGPCAFNLETLTASGALVRTRMRAHALGDETLFDCDLER